MPKILVAEDDFYLRDLYAELLKTEGFKVDVAADGPEAFTKLKEGGFDLVLLDIMLPKISGLQLLKKLKADPPLKENKIVVFLTNLGTEDVIKEGFKLGAVGYLIKSQLTPDQIVVEVKNYLAKVS